MTDLDDMRKRMSETALRPGQKVTLTGTVLRHYEADYWDVRVDGAVFGVKASALTPAVDPEPTWTPGDVVCIDGVNHMLRTDGIQRGWSSPDARTNLIDERNFSELWSEGRVVVVYRKEDDK